MVNNFMKTERFSSEAWLFYLLLAVFFFLFLLSFFLPLLSYQEARRAIIIQETYLFKSLIPLLNGEPYFTKPPLYTWLSLPFYALGNLFKQEIFFLRLPSFLSYLFTAYLIYLLCHKNLLKSILCLSILFSAFRFLSFIYRIDLEPLFIFFTTLSFYFLQRYLERPSQKLSLAFYTGLALAFLIRGPLHFFLLPALALLALFTKNKPLFRLLFSPVGWGLFLLLIFPWYLYGYLKFGFHIFQEFLHTDLSERLASPKDPFYYYFKALFLNFFSYFLLLFIKIKHLWKNHLIQLKAHPLSLYFSSLFIPLLLLSFTGSKFDKYLLYLYPIASLFFVEILLKIYSQKFLIRFVGIILFLNLLIVTLATYFPLKDLKTNTSLWIENLNPKKDYLFYQQAHPLAIFILQRPLAIIKQEEEAKEILKQGHYVLSPVELNFARQELVLPDPYKKGKYWYVYKALTF